MQGSSHTGFALAGAMMVNSAVYALFPLPLPNDWEWLLHAVGPPLTARTFVTFWQHPASLLTSETLLTLLYKLTFYLTLIACIMWPDRWERRTRADGTEELRFPPHRGPMHSVGLLILLIAGFGLLYDLTMAYIRLSHIVVSSVLLRELCVVAVGIVLAFLLHILADMFTRQGVKALWPAEVDVGIPPLPKQLRPTTGSWGEYAWLWLLIFVAGMLFAWGVIGL